MNRKAAPLDAHLHPEALKNIKKNQSQAGSQQKGIESALDIA